MFADGRDVFFRMPDGKQTTVCCDVKTGAVLWETKLGQRETGRELLFLVSC